MDDSRFLQYAPRPLFDGLVHTPERPRERPTSGHDDSVDARPVTMPLGAPDDTPAPSPSMHETQTARMAAYFHARPNRWISGLDLVRLGYGGWRTEISRLRHPPWNMHIGPPRYVPMILANGKRVRITEYRYEP